MKYVILIHSNPQPWGHPTGNFVTEALARPQEERERGGAAFDAMLEELSKSGELKGGEALGDPASSRILRWSESGTLVTDGPYAEAKEHLAGFFLLDVASQERAEELAVNFAGPGDTVELRPAYVWEQ
ncbi:YciI family protein [Terrabacter koreensis]